MPHLEPFAAIRFTAGPDQSQLVAPPYDVLSAADKDRLLARNKHNIVAIDLPHVPPKDAGPDAAYKAAADTLGTWLEKGILKRDEKPALYAYQQSYSHAGTSYRRRGFFTRIRLEEFATEGGTGTIHPHEQTFSGPKEDRLKLIRATRANLSPVFGLYDDQANDVTDLLFEAVITQKPAATAELPSHDGKSIVLSELWPVTDPAVIRDIQKMMAEKHIYIADGHHRYTTSLNYRKELAASRGKDLAPDDPANYALFVLVALQDPGLIILPTHRVLAAAGLKDFYLEAFMEAAEDHCEVMETKYRGDSLAALDRELPGFGPHAIGVYDPIEDAAVVIRPNSPDPLASLPDPALKSKSAPWRQLDVAILQHLIFDQIIAVRFGDGKMSWAFPHEAHEIASLCRTGAGGAGSEYRVGFLLQPTPLTAVRDLCNAHELMPQKSTFFYPKLATGMVINPLG